MRACGHEGGGRVVMLPQGGRGEEKAPRVRGAGLVVKLHIVIILLPYYHIVITFTMYNSKCKNLLTKVNNGIIKKEC